MNKVSEQRDRIYNIRLDVMEIQKVLCDYLALLRWAVEAREILANIDFYQPYSLKVTELLKELPE